MDSISGQYYKILRCAWIRRRYCQGKGSHQRNWMSAFSNSQSRQKNQNPVFFESDVENTSLLSLWVILLCTIFLLVNSPSANAKIIEQSQARLTLLANDDVNEIVSIGTESHSMAKGVGVLDSFSTIPTYPIAPELNNLRFLIGTEVAAAQWDIIDIVSPSDVSFSRYSKTINRGLQQPGTYWLTFKTNNSDVSGEYNEYFLHLGNQSFDSITVHVFSKDNKLTTVNTDSSSAFNKRPYPHHAIIIPVNLQPGLSTIYIRIQGERFNLNELQIYSQEKLNEQLQREQLSLGVYSGIITALMIFSLMLFVAVKESSYIYFTLFIATSLMYEILVNRLFLPYFPSYVGNSDKILAILIFIVSMCSAVQLSRQFLRLGHTNKAMDNILLGLCAVFLSLVPILMTGRSQQIYSFFDYLLFILLVTLTIISINSWQQKFSSAKYFVLGWSALLVSETLYKSSKSGFWGEQIIGQDTMYYLQAIVALLLSGALVHKVSQIKREKEFAQIQALKQSESHNRLQENFVKHLEELVQDRTKEVRSKNDQLMVVSKQQQRTSEVLSMLLEFSANLYTQNTIANIVDSSLQKLSLLFKDAGFCIAIYDRRKRCVTGYDIIGLNEKEVELIRKSSSSLQYQKNFDLNGWMKIQYELNHYNTQENVRWRLINMQTKEQAQVGYIFAKLPRDIMGDRAFTDIMEQFAMQISTAIENRRLSDQLEKVAATDSLTGLNNRAAFDRALEAVKDQSNESGQHSLLLIVDVNGLKKVNDTFGHSVGDVLITETAKLLKQCCEDDDNVARIGGDEFAIIRHNASYQEGVALKQIIQSRCAPIELESLGDANRFLKNIDLSLSIGVATSQHYQKIDALKHAADSEMYKDKKEYYKMHRIRENQSSMGHLIDFASEREKNSLITNKQVGSKYRDNSGL